MMWFNKVRRKVKDGKLSRTVCESCPADVRVDKMREAQDPSRVSGSRTRERVSKPLVSTSYEGSR
jgi:hypothetical protein